jgi:hypothetical protein
MLPVSLIYILFLLFSLLFAVRRFYFFGWGIVDCVFWVLVVLFIVFAKDIFVKYFLSLLERISFSITKRFSLFVRDSVSNEYCDSEVVEK